MMELRYVPIVAGNYIGSGVRTYDREKERDLRDMRERMECIRPCGAAPRRVYVPHMPGQETKGTGKCRAEKKKRQLRSTVLAVALAISCYLFFSGLAFLERGYTAYGGECLAPLVIGWLAYRIMEGGEDREDLLRLPKVRMRHGPGRGMQLSGIRAGVRGLHGRTGRKRGAGISRKEEPCPDPCRIRCGTGVKISSEKGSPRIITGDGGGMDIRSGTVHGHYITERGKSQICKRRYQDDHSGGHVS